MENITFISAGAGSGKTFRLANELEQILTGKDAAKPAGIIGTTFTNLAANELRERVRQRLNERGYSNIANQMELALLGTVNSVCGQLLNRFAFEAGLSPNLKVIEETEATQLFNRAFEAVSTSETVQELNALAVLFGDGKGAHDWSDVVRRVVVATRANDLTVEQLKVDGKRSLEEILKYLPPVSTKDLDAELGQALESAIKFIEDAVESGKETTNKSKDYLALIQGEKALLKDRVLNWSAWVKLSKAETGKTSLQACEAVQLIASSFEAHPKLHADITRYYELIFDVAVTALQQYQDEKKVRGLIDFTDQEHLLYQLLENASVQAVLKDEIDLLMVDEFQDTSPLQLALFLRLAKLAKKVVWVGDVKQAIYGFRGSDPELMQSVLKHLENNGIKTEVLNTSWRSRPELVSYVNSVFVPTFAHLLPKERVALEPRPNVKTHTEPAVQHWQLIGKNGGLCALALAKGVNDLITSGYQIIDKTSGELRAAHYGDVVVLSRTNDHLDDIAKAFAGFNIPMSRSQKGLLSTPETALVLAAIRFLVDRKDDLAIAELICLTQDQSPENWLQGRFEFLAKQEKDAVWGGDIPILKTLINQRERLQYLTPVELMRQAIVSADINQTVLRWDDNANAAKQRLLNVEQLVAFAEEYEQQCKNQGLAATAVGLLFWFEQLQKDKNDGQAESAHSNAVKLLTHHGAKGLEWPIVIALDLDSKVRNNIWGVMVRENANGFDITQPLAGRNIEFRLFPFASQEKGIQFKEKVENSDAGVKEKQRAEEEAKRLLYVTFTRPRDCLIIALANTKGEWINTLKPNEAEKDWALPLPNSEETITLTLPQVESDIPVVFKALVQDTAPDNANEAIVAPHWFKGVDESSASKNMSKQAATISPSYHPALASAKISEVKNLGERISLKGTPDMAHLGEAIHALIASYVINQPEDPRPLAEKVLSRYAVTEHISLEDALLCLERFNQFTRELGAKRIEVEYPIEYRLPNQQLASGWLDVLIETEAGYIIVDHKSNPMSQAEWEKNALKYSGQLALYKSAVEAITNKPVIGCWVHFAVTGGCLKVDF